MMIVDSWELNREQHGGQLLENERLGLAVF
jgi:hypothetical protein